MEEPTKQAVTAAGVGAALGGIAATGASVFCTSQGAGAVAEQCGYIAGTAVTTTVAVAAAVVGGVAGLGVMAWQRLRSRF